MEEPSDAGTLAWKGADAAGTKAGQDTGARGARSPI